MLAGNLEGFQSRLASTLSRVMACEVSRAGAGGAFGGGGAGGEGEARGGGTGGGGEGAGCGDDGGMA